MRKLDKSQTSVIRLSRERGFQAEGISRAKVLRKDPRWCDGGTVRKPELLERSKREDRKTGEDWIM